MWSWIAGVQTSPYAFAATAGLSDWLTPIALHTAPREVLTYDVASQEASHAPTRKVLSVIRCNLFPDRFRTILNWKF